MPAGLKEEHAAGAAVHVSELLFQPVENGRVAAQNAACAASEPELSRTTGVVVRKGEEPPLRMGEEASADVVVASEPQRVVPGEVDLVRGDARRRRAREPEGVEVRERGGEMRFERKGFADFRGFGRSGGFGHGVFFQIAVKQSGGPLHAVRPKRCLSTV